MKPWSIVLFVSFFLFLGCQEKKSEPEVKVQEKKSVESNIDEAAKVLKEQSSDAIDVASQMAKELTQASKEGIKTFKEEGTVVVRKVGESTKKALETTKEITEEVSKQIEQTAQVIDKTLQELPVKKQKSFVQLRGEELYLKCSGCHGLKGEKRALNKSKVIQGWDVNQTVEALEGYQKGIYGDSMKAVMQAQVKTLSQEDIEILAKYINTLK